MYVMIIYIMSCGCTSQVNVSRWIELQMMIWDTVA